uniref:ATP synthase complex subunit 8 n=1 Tax=Homonota fasciata TaxID=401549 RepID=A0A1Y1CC98_9SAUR|nr:ATPase subunit 8 [Homonota fasciata]
MPQLNPAPWFITLLTLWAILLVLKQPTTHLCTPTSAQTNTCAPRHTPWIWPWP